MDLIDAIRSRRMTRRFDPDRGVDDDVLHGVLDLARCAPRAGGTDGTDLVVLVDSNARQRFWDATSGTRPPNAWLRGVSAAPVLVVVTSSPAVYRERYAAEDKRDTGGAEVSGTAWWDTDAAMAAMLVLLGAQDAGLGALWCGIPAQRHDVVRATLGIPAERRLVGLLVLGHPAATTPTPPRARRRLPAHDDVVHRDGW